MWLGVEIVLHYCVRNAVLISPPRFRAQRMNGHLCVFVWKQGVSGGQGGRAGFSRARFLVAYWNRRVNPVWYKVLFSSRPPRYAGGIVIDEQEGATPVGPNK